MTQPDPDPILKPRRRDVLAVGAGLALTPAAAWAGRPRREALAVGYCEPEFDLDARELLAPFDVVAAERLAAGDATLAEGARLTVHGLLGDAGALARMGIRSAELRVGFPVARIDSSETEFRAWNHQVLPVENASSAVAFAVPADGGLALALEIETFGVERYETVLVTGREPGTPKLRTGTYLLATGAAPFRARRVDPAGPEPFVAFSVAPDAC